MSGDADGVGARAPGGPGTPRREWDAAPGAGGGGAGRGSGRDAPLRAAVVPRSWTSWWARTPTTTRRRRSAATTAASGSAYSRTCWRPARAACSPTASTWVGGRRRAPLRRAGPRARRGGTARGLRAGTQGSPHLPSSGSVCGPEVSHGKRNLGLPSSFTSQSAPSQMQLRRPLSGCVPGRRGGDSLCPRECVGGGLGALGGSAAILSGGAAGHGGAGVRKSCKATQGRGSRVKLPSLPLAVARSSSLGHPAVLGIGVSVVFLILLFSCFFALIAEEGFLLSLLAILWKSAFRCLYLSFSSLLFTSLLFTAICKASPDSYFAFLHFFSLGMVLIPVSCTMSRTSVHSSSGILSNLVP